MADLPDAVIEQRLGLLDDLLGQLERASDPVSDMAVRAVAALTEVYGAALARVVAADSGGHIVPALARDELVAHLLALHGLHPEPVADRAARALERVRPYVRSHGGEVTLAGVEDGVAKVALSGTCRGCASSAATLEHVVSDAVLAAAPELASVVADPGSPGAAEGTRTAPALIPVESLRRRPGAQDRGGATGQSGRSPVSARRGAVPAGQPQDRDLKESCDLCGQPVPAGHRHLVDTSSADLLCACHACTILFGRDQASEGRYRLVPESRRRLPGLSPASLGVPVGLAFFVRHPDGTVAAHYPSPAGATRWEVEPRLWARAVGDCPELAEAQPEVEAVLVNAARGRSEAWLVPIDDCYRLVAVVRQQWQGLSGGDRVWPEIEQFFDGLRRRDGAHSGR